MPVGDPGGPDSEVFFHFPQVPHDPRFGRFPHQNSDGGQYLEIGNSVFMEYRKTADGFVKLPRHNVDFGGGLERIAAASIDSPDVYRIDRLWPIVQALESMSGKTYDDATDRDAGRHRPHARSGAAGGRRGAAREQSPVRT